MRKLIKSIREYLELSQTEFADKIGVTFATVNRWENGRAIPTKLAQSTLYEYCKEHGVPVYQMILEKIKADADAVSLDGDRILLYHGSKSGIVGEIAPKSREMCEFGKGFYMGTDPGQPLTLICDFEKSKFYVVSVDMKNLDTIEIKADLDWAMLVAYHRQHRKRQDVLCPRQFLYRRDYRHGACEQPVRAQTRQAICRHHRKGVHCCTH